MKYAYLLFLALAISIHGSELGGGETRPILFAHTSTTSGAVVLDGTSGQNIKVILTGDATISVTGLASFETCVLVIDNSGGHTITYTTLIPDDGTAALANLDAENYPRVVIQQNDNSQTMAGNAGVWRN